MFRKNPSVGVYARLSGRDLTNAAPITRVDEIPGSAPYRGLGTNRRSIHVGQLKLFLSEVQFLRQYAPPSSNPVVIYAGSAPGHTRQVLADLFPHIKAFVLIDPHEHYVMGRERGRNCLYARVSSGKAQVPYADGIRFLSRSGEIVAPKHESLNEQGFSEMNELARAIVSAIAHSRARFYIIEDIFTDELASAFAQAFAQARPILFISDIRTRAEDEADSPNDFDIVTNNMMQHIWVYLLQPDACMLKFRTPFFSPDDVDVPAKLASAPICARYRDTFGIPIEQVYARAGASADAGAPAGAEYHYLANVALNLQAFPGNSSTEVRLIATPSATDGYRRLIIYRPRAHEEALFYYNQMRDHAFTPRWSRWFRGPVTGFDGCPDCDLAIRILDDRNFAQAPIFILEKVLRICGRTLAQGLHGYRYKPIAQ